MDPGFNYSREFVSIRGSLPLAATIPNPPAA